MATQNQECSGQINTVLSSIEMGFNNPGASEVKKRLNERKAADKWPKFPVAANIGRSKKVPNEHASEDYSATLDMLCGIMPICLC